MGVSLGNPVGVMVLNHITIVAKMLQYCHKADLLIDLQHFPQWADTTGDITGIATSVHTA